MQHRLMRIASLAAALVLVCAGIAAARDSKVADAAEERSTSVLTALLKQKADVNAPQGDGATALHWAAHWDDLAMAAALLRAGARSDATNDYGVTPLFLAATNGSPQMVAALLKSGANPNAALATGQTVLMTAARTGNVAAVEALLSAGATVDAKHSAKEQTALMWAIAERHSDVARVLIEHGANVKASTKSGFTPLLFAAREGDLASARLLLAKGVDVNESANSDMAQLQPSTEGGREGAYSRNTSSFDGATPLLVATVRGHVDLALFLLEQGAHPDGDLAVAGYSPLHWASTTFELTPITYPGVAAPGEWNAMAGIPDRSQKITLIKALLARGANVNARTTKRPLTQASLGAVFTSSPGVGATPLFAAAGSADVEVMRLLLAHGADPSIKSANDETLVMIASAVDTEISVNLPEAKRLEVVRLGLELGNDIEAQDKGGHRALHLAARGGLHDIITSLVQHGADLNPKTKSRKDARGGVIPEQTPLALAEGTVYSLFLERPLTAELLRKLGARSEGRYYPLDSPNRAETAQAPK